MAFIAEDGTGVTGANSLASVAFADTYHADRGNGAWAALALERKQALLIQATDYIAMVFASSWLGYPVSRSQSLPFPRVVNGVNVGNPVSIQQATADLAMTANTGPLIPTNKTRTKKSVKVGPISVQYDGDGSNATNFYNATLKIAPWLQSGALNPNQVRLTRV